MPLHLEADPGDTMTPEPHYRLVDGEQIDVIVLLPRDVSPELRNTEVLRAVSEECYRRHGVGRLVRTVNGLSYVRAEFPHRRGRPSSN